jgi:hypothetical protein
MLLSDVPERTLAGLAAVVVDLGFEETLQNVQGFKLGVLPIVILISNND